MNQSPERVKASLWYVLGTAVLGGVAGASFSFVVASALGVSAIVAAVVSGVAMAGIVGALVYRHGRPADE